MWEDVSFGQPPITFIEAKKELLTFSSSSRFPSDRYDFGYLGCYPLPCNSHHQDDNSLRLRNCLKPFCETVAGWRVDSTYEFYDKSSICLNRIPSHLSFPPKYQHSWEFTTIPNLPDIAGASSHAAPAIVQRVQQPLPPKENTKVTPHAPLGKTTHRNHGSSPKMAIPRGVPKNHPST